MDHVKDILLRSAREITGRKEEVFDIHDVKGCLASIRVKYGRLAYKEARRSLITLNGISIVSLDNYRTKVKPEDEVRFLTVCGGG